jgi:hypothetical protein
MATFTERIVGAAILDTRIYEEVEADQSATPQAMLVVIGAALAGGLGALYLGVGPVILSIIAALVGWAVWAGLTFLIGTRLMPEPQTHADWGQMLRVLGFAAAPGLLNVFAIIPLLGYVIRFIVSIWQLVAMVIAVRQGLDYTSTARAIVVCLIGFIAYWAIAWVMMLLGGRAFI